MKTRNIILVTALVMGVTALTSCGGRGNKSGHTSQTEGEDVAATAVEEKTKAPERQAKPEVSAKKWYEQDFSLTEKMYVSGASMSRVYARKGNVLTFKMEEENGLPYYKYCLSKKNGSVYIEGKAFEVTAFSAEPSYEGLIVSLNGLMEVSK